MGTMIGSVYPTFQKPRTVERDEDLTDANVDCQAENAAFAASNPHYKNYRGLVQELVEDRGVIFVYPDVACTAESE
jgi:hypothetical protein